MKARKIISLLLALTMVLALGSVVAIADGEATKYDLSNAYLTKDLEVGDDVDLEFINVNGTLPVKTFRFSFTGQNGTGTTASEATDAVQTTQRVTVERPATKNGHAYGRLPLSEVFQIANFHHAGEYVYQVAEATPAFTTTVNDETKTLTKDNAVYTVRVYVTNGTNGLEFSGVTVEKAGEKVDPTITPSGQTSGFVFNNTYKVVYHKDEGVLSVKKSITGAYGDKTKKFPISVTVTIPDADNVEEVVALGPSNSALTPVVNGQSLTYTAELADNEAIKFTTLPKDSTFTVSETQDPAYKSKITGWVQTEETAYTAGNRTNIPGKPVTEDGVTAVIENNREDIIPTGVIISNLPYVLLVLVAAAGVAYLTLKKRNNNA